MNKAMLWNIHENNKILSEYDKYRIKKLPERIWERSVNKSQYDRTKSKLIYECVDDNKMVWYEVFINFVLPVPLNFWPVSLYDCVEKYPTDSEFIYRAWKFDHRKDAIDKYLSLK